MAKVNKVNPGEEKKEKKEEKGRIEFPVKEAKYYGKDGKIVSAINSDGLLIAVPVPIKDNAGKVVYGGFNVRKHLPLKKNEFASVVEYMRYQAYIARIKAGILIKSAEEKETKATRMEKFGDDVTRKKVQRVARMREQLEALQKQLAEEGINVEDLN